MRHPPAGTAAGHRSRQRSVPCVRPSCVRPSQTLAAIVHIGALGHEDVQLRDGSACEGVPTSLVTASRLLEIPLEQLRHRLAQKTIRVANEEISSPLSDTEFLAVRDGLAMGVYARCPLQYPCLRSGLH